MAHVKGHEKGKVQKKKKSKPLTKRIYTGGIFAGPGAIKTREKKRISDLRAKYRKDKKAIKESTDWDDTNDEKLEKLLEKHVDNLDKIEEQSWKDHALITDYGLRGAKARSFMTERKEKYSKKHGGKITYKMSGGQVVDSGYE
tara:strand:+ start:42 stop:470 length:429 start_codon:yes stop_codon:yes gene_type:complete